VRKAEILTMLTNTEVPSAAEILRRSAEEIDGALRVAIAGLPAPLRIAAGFHFGWWDAAERHIIGMPGKMVRPAFALSSARAVSGRANECAVRMGVAIELVHNFSLVHDDVIDADEMRRGRPTVWAQFGVPCAILLGDALLALASQSLADGADDTTACRVLHEIVLALCLGQHQDVLFEHRSSVTVEEYLEMATGKTAALLSGACALGAMAGGANTAQLAELREFGHHIGLAFQLVDDVLGIWGDPAITGKPVGADLLRYKQSMPVVAAMNSGTTEGDELADLYQRRLITDERVLSRAVRLVAEAGGRERSESEAARHTELALECLDELGGEMRAVGELRALAELVVRRNR
jgi:geranylgeranyl diphosphate synthase type I